VRVTPLDPAFKTDDNSLGMSLDKQCHGDLDATAKGEMLTGGAAVKDSGAYVAMERVSGTLRGRTGSFLLRHSGTMNVNLTDSRVIVRAESAGSLVSAL
jgi:Protein of unknown function (DUF3224)